MIGILAWIAVCFELFGNYLIGDKCRYGFLIKVCGSLAWLSVGVLSAVHGLTVSAILGGAISIRSWVHWGK